jgi:hypothetical protein
MLNPRRNPGRLGSKQQATAGPLPAASLHAVAGALYHCLKPRRTQTPPPTTGMCMRCFGNSCGCRLQPRAAAPAAHQVM